MPISNDGNTKICSKCGIRKNIEEFTNRKSSPDGKTSECKVCRAEYRRNNTDKINETKRTYYKTYMSNPKVKQSIKARNILRTFVRSVQNGLNVHPPSDLGCNAEEFITYITNDAISKGYDDFDFMTYDTSVYHMDHITPMKSYIDGYSTLEELSHYTNIQILKAKDNLIKGEIY